MPLSKVETNPITFRSARHGDGAALWSVIRSAGTLEVNSAYFYLLFASDFGDTCLVAEQDNEIVGAVIGYRPPREPDAAFVWQVGIAPSLRGQGLGRKLLEQWLTLPANADARWMTATISADNEASQGLFRGFARRVGVTCEDFEHFTEALFPGEHEAERMFRIGPLTRVGKPGQRRVAAHAAHAPDRDAA